MNPMQKRYGLHIRTKAGIWHYRFSIRGKVYRGTTGTSDYVLAEQYAHKVFNDLYLEKHELRPPQPKNILVSDFVQQYLKALQYEASSHHVYSVERTLIEFVGFLTSHNVQFLHEITVQILEQYKIDQMQKVKRITVSNKIRRAKAFLNRAVRLELIKDNPAKKLSRIGGIPKSRIRFFSEEEIIKIMEAFDNPLYQRFAYMKDFVKVALYTGMRRGEITNLEFGDVDLTRKQIYVRNKKDFTTKSYKDRVIPLHNELMPFFSQGGKGLCFLHENKKYNPKTTTKNFGLLLDRLGIEGEGVGLYTLRHSFASYLIMNGVSMRLVAEYLGHSTTLITELYSHLSPEYIQTEIIKLKFNVNRGNTEIRKAEGNIICAAQPN